MFVRQICTNLFNLIRWIFSWISVFRLSFNHTLETCANFIYSPNSSLLFSILLNDSPTFRIVWNNSYKFLLRTKIAKCIAHRINNIIIVDIFRNLDGSTVSFYSRLITKLFFVKLNWWWINNPLIFLSEGYIKKTEFLYYMYFAIIFASSFITRYSI